MLVRETAATDRTTGGEGRTVVAAAKMDKRRELW
jgi:hypothetical protein